MARTTATKLLKSKAIGALSETRSAIVFPQTNRAFDTFYRELKDLVQENFGYSAKETFGYCEDSGKFSFRERDRVGKLNGSMIFIERVYLIDPTLSLVEEFTRIVGERAANDDNRLAMMAFCDGASL